MLKSRRIAKLLRTGLTPLLAATLAVAAACGGSDTSGDPLTVGSMSETVVMEHTKFQPGNLQVPVGATITFTNRDPAPHDAQAEDGSWETEQLGDGESDKVTFDEPGEWFYKCTIHPSMKARITVEENVRGLRPRRHMNSESVIMRCPGARYGRPCACPCCETAWDDGLDMGAFIPGLELARSFHIEVVRPILREHVPGFTYAAALIGTGSEVLSFDSERSVDHHWGPRVMLFTSRDHAARYAADVHEQLATRLPAAFRGVPTNFGPPDEHGVRLLEQADGPPIAHRVEVLSLPRFLEDFLGFHPRSGVSTADWLFTPSQRLLEMTAGEVFEDPSAMLTTVRAALTWYPHDVWLFLIARQWQRIAQEEAFVGRCAEAGDEIGSHVATARIVRDLMRLCFLFERRYAPYSKWLGTGFERLPLADGLTDFIERALAATEFNEREEALAGAYENIAALHNALGISQSVDCGVRPYYGRPYVVLHAERFVNATLDSIDGAFLGSVAHIPGSIDQIVDNTDIVSDPAAWRRIREAYREA